MCARACFEADYISKWAAQPANQVFITPKLRLAFLPFLSPADPTCSTLTFFSAIYVEAVAFAEDAVWYHLSSAHSFICPPRAKIFPIIQTMCASAHSRPSASARVRRKMDKCWEDECRRQPLLSDPDCKSVKALTADCSGLQRRKT